MNNRKKKFALVVFLAIGQLVLLGRGEVETVVRAAAEDIPDKDILAVEVKKLEVSMPRKQLVKELIDELMGANSPVTEVVVNRMLLGMEPFPFQDIHEQLTPEGNSTKRAYLLFLLNKGASAPAQVDEVLAVAKSMLGDKDKGIRRYGEARAIFLKMEIAFFLATVKFMA